MQYSVSYRQRDGAAAVARKAEANLGSIEEETTRLRSWAAILGIPLLGTPFLRFPNGGVMVNIAIAREAHPNPQTGVVESALPGGPALAIEEVPFEQIAAVLGGISAEEPSAEGSQAEFHRSADGFGHGTLVIPIADGARARNGRHAASGASL